MINRVEPIYYRAFPLMQYSRSLSNPYLPTLLHSARLLGLCQIARSLAEATLEPLASVSVTISNINTHKKAQDTGALEKNEKISTG